MLHRILAIFLLANFILISQLNAVPPYISLTKPGPSSPAVGTLQGQGIYDGDPAAYNYEKIEVIFAEATPGPKTSRKTYKRLLKVHGIEVTEQKFIAGKWTQGSFSFKQAGLKKATLYQINANLFLQLQGKADELTVNSQQGILRKTQ